MKMAENQKEIEKEYKSLFESLWFRIPIIILFSIWVLTIIYVLTKFILS